MAVGEEAAERLRKSSVLVVGLGGVGGYAAEMLVRAGVGTITIADGDTIHPSNRNRQLLALQSTEGHLKAEVMGERLLDINPELNLTIIPEFIRDDRMIEILDRKFEWVVDAIDTLSPKVFLIYHSLQRGMKVVSSMGAGGRFDPSQVLVSDISETCNCTLARIVRKRLHRLGIREGFRAVYSPESIDKERVVEVKGERNKASAVGTISYMPAIFGINCASVVIRDIIA
ncbi:MAG: tRNA threonylcarbamoyladenosine dehydratase [Bacteroidetes bacterium]|nr:tRNA threonylcarbamoyladenosine dehydratase [Bacteroidota bacterium]